MIRDVLANYAAHGPTAAELADAKTYLTGSYPLAFSSNAGIAAQLGSFQLLPVRCRIAPECEQRRDSPHESAPL